MALGYRAVFRLPETVDAIDVVNQELHAWLESKVRGDDRRRLQSGELLQPGVHEIHGGMTVIIARADHEKDSSRRQYFRLTESNAGGEWEVTVAAFSLPNASKHRQTLVIAAERVDDKNAPGEVDPPRLVRQLLARETVLDGKTHLSAEPRLIRVHQVDEVIEAILDEDRSASVIVAASLGPELDEALRLRIRSLTSKIVGVAAIFVVTEDALAELADRIPESHGVKPGRVRTYLPNVDINDPVDGRRHRVLGPATFTRAIRGNHVSRALQGTYAIETRSRLAAADLPPDVRRGLDLLRSERAAIRRDFDVARRIKDAHAAAVVTRTAKRSATPKLRKPESTGLMQRLTQSLRRWLNVESHPRVEHLDDLDRFILREQATSETLLGEAETLEKRLIEERDKSREKSALAEDLELAAAEAEEEARRLEREVVVLRNRLILAGRSQDTLIEASDNGWADPEDILELITRLTPGGERHAAFERVEFTGDPAAALEVQQRDPVGRYARAFWSYVRVLHDYAEARVSGDYSGNVHSYLSDDNVVGAKCSLARHAAKESDATIQQWGSERIFPVPESVYPSGQILMEAHFRPTHRDTFAPRMHYFDDTNGSGKILIGYIGRHLTNTRTKNM